jgi:hypothetical protein
MSLYSYLNLNLDSDLSEIYRSGLDTFRFKIPRINTLYTLEDLRNLPWVRLGWFIFEESNLEDRGQERYLINNATITPSGRAAIDRYDELMKTLSDCWLMRDWRLSIPGYTK